MLRKLLSGALSGVIALALMIGDARAATYFDSDGQEVLPYVIVDPTGKTGALFTSSNPGHVAGSFSATLSGFAPASVGTPISATTSGATGTLPAGVTVIAENVGSYPAYCQLGSSTSGIASSKQISASGGQWAIVPGSATQITCEGVGGTTTINLLGGSGLGVDTGGGSSGGGGGTVAQGTAGSAGGAWFFAPTQGGSVLSATNGGYTNLLQTNAALSATNGLYANLLQGNAALSATNGLYANLLVGNAAVSTGAGATGTGTQRVGVAQDTTTIAGSAPGTAGSPSPNVVTVQWPSSGGTNATVNPGTIALWGLATIGAGTAPTNAMIGGGVYNSGGVALTTGQSVALQLTAGGSLHTTVDNSLNAIEWNADGVANTTTGSPTFSLLAAFNGSSVDRLEDDANKNLKVAPQATASGGALNYGPLFSAASNNATNVKASAGTVYSITVTQSTTTAMELKLYNTSSSPTCSSGTGLVDVIPIPSSATSPGYHLPYPVGRAFSTGISYCLVAFGNPASATDNGNAVTGVTLSMTYE